eukprot:2755592-Pleurochrysis_carterae.AAC.2
MSSLESADGKKRWAYGHPGKGYWYGEGRGAGQSGGIRRAVSRSGCLRESHYREALQAPHGVRHPSSSG